MSSFLTFVICIYMFKCKVYTLHFKYTSVKYRVNEKFSSVEIVILFRGKFWDKTTLHNFLKLRSVPGNSAEKITNVEALWDVYQAVQGRSLHSIWTYKLLVHNISVLVLCWFTIWVILWKYKQIVCDFYFDDNNRSQVSF